MLITQWLAVRPHRVIGWVPRTDPKEKVVRMLTVIKSASAKFPPLAKQACHKEIPGCLVK